MTVQHTCPVCAYSEMPDPAEDFNICPCCGTEFGYDDDFGVTHGELRARWVAQGAPWFSRATPPPVNWSASRQLSLAGYEPLPPVEWRDTTENRTEATATGIQTAVDIELEAVA
jgi:hypothetical protein